MIKPTREISMIEAHGGNIEVKSIIGKGIDFYYKNMIRKSHN